MTESIRPAPDDEVTILDQVHQTLLNYVILPSPEAADAVTLWIAATHAQTAWAHAPRLVIRAPEKRCGKSRLLDVVEGMCHNPLITVNASPAAVYRAIGSDNPPTLLIDEADTIFGGDNAKTNEDLRGLLNAGHQRNRPTIRWDSNNRTLEKIPTFAMAALAGIGAMPDTIEDRAVIIRMRRRTKEEKVKPFRVRRDAPILHQSRGALAGWIGEHLSELEKAEPDMPVEDRAADTWEPLVAIADLAGGTWPEQARKAILALTGEAESTTIPPDRIRLLVDIRTAFGTAEALPTTVLIERLRADPETPWADYNGTGLTPIRLAWLLRDYGIGSKNIRFAPPIDQAKGYYRADFTDAWNRYTPVPEPAPDMSADPNPSQPYQPSQPSSEQGRLETWDGSNRPSQDLVPGLACTGTAGTAGTATPRLHVVRTTG